MSVRYGEKKFASKSQEKNVAEKINGRVQIASGALDEKGDVKSEQFLIECKTTGKLSYPLRYSTWNKIREEAYTGQPQESGEKPVDPVCREDFDQACGSCRCSR